MNKKHYLIYQITNNINQKFYIGKHETYNIDDNYFGSGKYLKHAIEKYGIENFTKTILFELQSREEMNLLEKVVVTSEFCAREDTYNINVGGDGGWIYINESGLNTSGKWHSINEYSLRIKQETGEYPSAKRRRELLKDFNYRKNYGQKVSNGLKRYIAEHGAICQGKHHSEETKVKIRASRYDGHGKNNSMYGTMWICNDKTHESKKILKTDDIPVGWRKGRFCK